MLTPISIVAASGSIVDIDKTVFIQLGVFLLLFLVLRQLLFKPVIRLIEARRLATEGTRTEAKAFDEEATKLSGDVEQQLADIRSSATAERRRMVDQAKRQERELLIKAREDSRAMIDQTKQELESQAEQAKQTLREEIDAMVDVVATKVLGRAV